MSNKYTERTVLNRCFRDSENVIGTEVSSHRYDALILSDVSDVSVSGESDDINVEKYICGELCLSVSSVSGTFAAGEGLRVIVEGKDEITGLYKIIYDSESSLGGLITSTVVDWYTMTQNPFKHIRVRWEISGTTPSFTFSVTMGAKT